MQVSEHQYPADLIRLAESITHGSRAHHITFQSAEVSSKGVHRHQCRPYRVDPKGMRCRGRIVGEAQRTHEVLKAGNSINSSTFILHVPLHAILSSVLAHWSHELILCGRLPSELLYRDLHILALSNQARTRIPHIPPHTIRPTGNHSSPSLEFCHSLCYNLW